MSEQDGGPAFPVPDGRGHPHSFGMSLRDYLAAKALVGMFSGGGHRDVAAAIEEECRDQAIATTATDIGHFAEERIASMAYAMADAMLAERAKSNAEGR